ncbi:MAG: glycosyltransferase family 9 protein, partial [Burkholderiaceae bacterium]
MNLSAIYPAVAHDLPSPDETSRGDWLRGLNKIAVFRALQLGDMLCTVPALRALRAAAPQAEIVLVGLPWAKAFVERFPMLVDRHVAFPGFPGFPEQLPALDWLPAFFAAMQAENFDLAIQMHGSGGLSNPLVAAFGAPVTAGYHRADQYCPDGARCAVWQDGEHEILRYLDLMDFLGCETYGETLEFPLRDDDFARLRALGATLPGGLPAAGGYVCVHPGAQLASRRWPPERFAAVADALHDAGFAIVLTGTEGERPVVEAVAAAMRAPALDLAGRTDLGMLGALLAQAALLVSNDTGVAHVAVGTATRSVVVSSGAAPQ